METVNRFDNTPVEINGHIFWNIPSLLANIRSGLLSAKEKYGDIAAVGVDTWGVDYGLLDESDALLAQAQALRARANAGRSQPLRSM